MKKLLLTIALVFAAVPVFAGGRIMDYTMDNGVSVANAYLEITDLNYSANSNSYYIYNVYKDEQSFIDGKAPLGSIRYDVAYSDVQSRFSDLIAAIRTALYAHSDATLEIDSDGDGEFDRSRVYGAVNN